MLPIYSAATLSVAAVFYVWRAYALVCQRRVCQLHSRVAHMLWVMADLEDEVALAGPAER
jgi:hypothetical protein